MPKVPQSHCVPVNVKQLWAVEERKRVEENKISKFIQSLDKKGTVVTSIYYHLKYVTEKTFVANYLKLADFFLKKAIEADWVTGHTYVVLCCEHDIATQQTSLSSCQASVQSPRFNIKVGRLQA